MRRIYESGAVRRDDDDPFSPGERDTRPQALRSVDGTAWSRRLVPGWVRTRAVSVDIEAPERVSGSVVPFVVTMSNALPIPVTIEARSARVWGWAVDGLPRASHVEERLPDERRAIRFDRGETKRFRRQWDRLFQVTENEWEPADPGEYTISAGLNVTDASKKSLYSETTVRIE